MSKALGQPESGLLVDGVTGFRDVLTGTETGIQPSVTRLQHILERFLRRIALTRAMLEVRDFRHITGFVVVPKDIDVIMRDVHCTGAKLIQDAGFVK